VIKGVINKVKKNHDLAPNDTVLVVIDYLQLMLSSDKSLDSSANEVLMVSKISTELKQLARETKSVGCVLYAPPTITKILSSMTNDNSQHLPANLQELFRGDLPPAGNNTSKKPKPQPLEDIPKQAQEVLSYIDSDQQQKKKQQTKGSVEQAGDPLMTPECLVDIADFLIMALALEPEAEARQAIGELRLTYPAPVLKEAAKRLTEAQRNLLRDWLVNEKVLLHAPTEGDRVCFADQSFASVITFTDKAYLLHSEELNQDFELGYEYFDNHLVKDNQLIHWIINQEISNLISPPPDPLSPPRLFEERGPGGEEINPIHQRDPEVMVTEDEEINPIHQRDPEVMVTEDEEINPIHQRDPEVMVTEDEEINPIHQRDPEVMVTEDEEINPIHQRDPEVMVTEDEEINPIHQRDPEVMVTEDEAIPFILIATPEDLTRQIAKIQKQNLLAIDTETTGLDPHKDRLRLIQIATRDHPTLIIDCFQIFDLSPVAQLLANSDITIVGHNLKFDLKFLMKNGINPKCKAFDTMLASQVIKAGLKATHKLKDVVKQYLGIELDKSQQQADWSRETLYNEQLTYAALDAKILLPLKQRLEQTLRQDSLTRVAEIEFGCVYAVAEMELKGMLLDKERWLQLQQDMNHQREKALAKCQELFQDSKIQSSLLPEFDIINFDSPDQVKKALGDLGIVVKSTAHKELAPLAEQYPAVAAFLAYRKLSRFESNCAQSLLEQIHIVTGRLHSDFKQLGAVSGRFSSRDPNLQNIPRDNLVRQCFCAPPGSKLIIADYSQIELRIVAEISGDKRMIEAYQNGEDLHKVTASLILHKPLEEVTKADRQIAKSLNFGLVYAMQVYGLQSYAENNYGVKLTEKQARDFYNRFFQSYSGLAKWHEANNLKLKQNKITETRTLSQRRRMWTVDEKPKLNEVVNLPVQGTSADITKIALLRLRDALTPTGAQIIGTVHDEIILETPEATAMEAAEILKKTMIAAGEEFLKVVPLEVEVTIADDWGEK